MAQVQLPLIAPSILNSDFARLGETIQMLNTSQADWIHVDVMDGVFVPNISFGFPIMESLHRLAKKPLDVHLMIADPSPYLSRFAQLGAQRITVHLEACTHIDRVIQQIHALGIKAGVALNPGTPVSQVRDLLYAVDQVLLMSVNPGFGGQAFIPNTYKKVETLHQLISQVGRPILIEVDGGIDGDNIEPLAKSGVHAMVIGSYIFHADDPLETISALKKNSTHSLQQWS